MSHGEPTPTAAYAERVSVWAAKRDDLRQRWDRLANLRLIAGLATIAAVVLAVAIEPWWLPGAAAVLLALVFAQLVRRHRAVGRDLRWAVAFHDLNAEAIARRARDWNALPLRQTALANPRHAYAADLDLFGRASLLHLLETVETAMGEAQLAAWLAEPAPPSDIRRRQEVVRALAPALEWRQTLAAHGRLIGDEFPDPAPFLAWAESTAMLEGRDRLVWAARIGAGAVAVAVIASLLGLIPGGRWLAPMLFNLLLVAFASRDLRGQIATVADSHRSIGQYGQMLHHAVSLPADGVLSTALRARLGEKGDEAAVAVRALERLSSRVVPPGALAWFPLQAICAWDLLIVGRPLGRWQQAHGQRVRGWLDALGEIEALAALGALAHDQPGWAFPEIDPAADRLSATVLGHPLLADGVRVANDLALGPAGQFLLVTGSNMSGKSTLLRAIGVNLVLAGMGAPVCASSFRCPPVRLWTSVHVSDSLAAGISFYMAELQRLKAVVDAAQAPDPAQRPLFFLLDEILQGTNTAERQIAARRVVAALLEAGAFGAVSTHDLALADGPDLAPAMQAVHLRDRVTAGPNGPEMHFDYQLHPGIAPSTNAIALMEIVFGERGTIVHDRPAPEDAERGPD